MQKCNEVLLTVAPSDQQRETPVLAQNRGTLDTQQTNVSRTDGIQAMLGAPQHNIQKEISNIGVVALPGIGELHTSPINAQKGREDPHNQIGEKIGKEKNVTMGPSSSAEHIRAQQKPHNDDGLIVNLQKTWGRRNLIDRKGK